MDKPGSQPYRYGPAVLKLAGMDNKVDVDEQDLDPYEMYQGRPEHVQQPIEPEVRTFQGCQFVGYITGDMKMKPSTGSMQVTLSIPMEFAHLAADLRFAGGLPLSVDIQIWEEYLQAAKGGGI